jgi:hypothetical protein
MKMVEKLRAIADVEDNGERLQYKNILYTLQYHYNNRVIPGSKNKLILLGPFFKAIYGGPSAVCGKKFEQFVKTGNPIVTDADTEAYIAKLTRKQYGDFSNQIGSLNESIRMAIFAELDQHKDALFNTSRRSFNELNARIEKAALGYAPVGATVQYYLKFGYDAPPSRPYASFGAVKRAHSKRNMPDLWCEMYQIVNGKERPFMRWNPENRVWEFWDDK